MISLTSGKLSFSITSDASSVFWSANGTPLCQSKNADFWRAFVDDGYEREIKISSSLQKGEATFNQDEIIVKYNSLKSDNGRVFDVSLTITIKRAIETKEGFLFSASVENNDNVRVNEIMLPLIDLEKGCDENAENDVFYHINGLGQTIKNPWDSVRNSSHTEYISSDNHQVWNSMRYPGDAAMAWFGLQTNGHFLYIGRHDPKLKICVLSVGTSPRNASPRLMITISHFPFAKQGETVKITECFVSLNEGDWRTGSDIYSGYARKHWYTPPVIPEWVKNFTGWQRVILRHQFGEINFKYEDLPQIYQNGKKYGLNMLMVFGWWKGRFDNGYPVYEPDEALGGAQKLAEAIAEVQSMGGRVALYTNGQLIDVNTDYYREIGYKICRIDIDGNDYRDHYRFGNDGTTLRAFGYKSFVTACPANEEWQNRLVMHEKMKLDFGCDSAFFDQIGGAAPLPCFNENHFHGARADECEIWRVEAFKKMFANCPEGKALGTEMVNDMVLSHVHYIHGIQLGAVFGANCFPKMFIRTFPEVIQTDRFIHDNKEGTDRSLGNAFIHGFRLDICPWRGRTDISSMPELGEKVLNYLTLKEKYRRFFYDGKIVCEEQPDVPSCIKYGEFHNGDDKMFALWNDSSQIVKFKIFDKEISMKPQELTCVCSN